jgi:hypothetical protein
MDPIIFSLIMLGATVGTTVIQGLAQKSANEKARISARGIAEQNRADEQSQLKITNRLAKNKLNFNEQKLQQSNAMLNEYKKDKRTEQNYLLNKTTQGFLGETAKRTLGTDEDWLMKSKLLNRF